MSRTGRQYIESLRDDRVVFVDGERVKDVTTHPGFAGPVAAIARLYDIAASPEHREVMTYPSPRTGQPVNKAFLPPRSVDDLRARRRAHRMWADATYGLMGRSPDHVPGFLTGFMLRADLFASAGARFGDNVVAYYEKVRDEDLYVSYVIVPPQIDKSKASHEQRDPHQVAGVVAERDGGIVVRGAQILGTGSAMSNEVLLTNIIPLKPGDENHAISCAIPINAPGVRMIVRRPYAAGQPSVFDYPLSTRFDETDAVLIFDDVFVPWERVFIYRNVVLTGAQLFDTPAHVLGNFQAQVRFGSKAEFLVGLAYKIAEANGVGKLPATMTVLGEMASYASMASGLVLAAENDCARDPERGFVYPNPQYVYANNWLQATYYGTLLNYIRELSGAGLLQVPATYRDWENADTAADMNRFLRPPGGDAVDRVKLFKLAWDLVGSEFAGRHAQYELFYAGARALTTSVRLYKAYDYAGAARRVDDCLAGYGLPGRPKA